MTRRNWIRCFTALLASLAALPLGRRHASAQQVANLKETLQSVLKCRRPEEFAFVDLVVGKVNAGQLPLALVLSMMTWARKRRDDIPFPYFQEGIKQRAAELGVTL